MKQLSRNILIQGFVFFLLNAGPVSDAFAQERSYHMPTSSSVQVDTSVLQQMEAARYGSAAQIQRYDAQRIYSNRVQKKEKTIKLPVIPPPSFRTTASYKSVKDAPKTYTPTLTAPSGKAVDTYISPTPVPSPSLPAVTYGSGTSVIEPSESLQREVIEWNSPPYYGTSRVLPPNSEREAVLFPVKVKERTDSFDPSLTKDLPAGKEVQSFDNIYGESIAGQSSVSSSSLPEVVGMQIPVPKRRPAIQNASLSFVNKARENMDVPAIEEHSELMKKATDSLPYYQDDLGKTLTEPDRKTVVEHVNTHLPEQDKKKQLEITDPVPITTSVTVNEKPITEQKNKAQISLKKENAMHIPRPPADENEQDKKFISVPFAIGKSDLDIRQQKILNENVLQILKQNSGWRIQIQAFASADNKEQASSRRLSLSRALSIRDYLMKNGIDAKQIDVRALGDQTNRTPADRVDLVFFTPENG